MDLQSALERAKRNVRTHYVDPTTAFTDKVVFDKYYDMLDIDGPNSMLVWDTDPQSADADARAEHLAIKAGDRYFTVGGVPDRTGQRGRHPRSPQRILKLGMLLDTIRTRVERQLTQAAQMVLDDLTTRYPSDALLSALQLADPRFWQGQQQPGGSYTPPTLAEVRERLAVLKQQFGTACTTDAGLVVPPKLGVAHMEEQLANFCGDAHASAKKAFDRVRRKELDEDKLTRWFWRDLQQIPALRVACDEWLTFARLALTIVPGSVEAERAFSALTYIKNSMRNRLGHEHLNACMLAFTQHWFDISTFPYKDALEAWYAAKQWRKVDAAVAGPSS